MFVSCPYVPPEYILDMECIDCNQGIREEANEKNRKIQVLTTWPFQLSENRAALFMNADS